MAIAYVSPIYAFDYIIQMRKGYRVLIQSASDYLGLAAIQVARSRGAKIFAIADDPESMSFLADTAGILRHHILPDDDEE